MENDKYIGRLLGGRYELIDVVGVGGMAVVYRARDTILGRYVAIKILKGEAEPATMPIEKAQKFDYVISKEFVDAIGLEVPAELQQYVK